jgi:hypothetical protein
MSAIATAFILLIDRYAAAAQVREAQAGADSQQSSTFLSGLGFLTPSVEL